MRSIPAKEFFCEIGIDDKENNSFDTVADSNIDLSKDSLLEVLSVSVQFYSFILSLKEWYPHEWEGVLIDCIPKALEEGCIPLHLSSRLKIVLVGGCECECEDEGSYRDQLKEHEYE